MYLFYKERNSYVRRHLWRAFIADIKNPAWRRHGKKKKYIDNNVCKTFNQLQSPLFCFVFSIKPDIKDTIRAIVPKLFRPGVSLAN